MTLSGTLLGARRAEMRAALRTYLSPFLPKLAEGLHVCLASAIVLRKVNMESGLAQSSWRTRAEIGKVKLEDVRPTLPYAMPGLDEPLRQMRRVPDRVSTYGATPESNAEEYLKKADELRAYVDKVVVRCYRRGLPPSRHHQWKLLRLAKQLEGLWGVRFNNSPSKADRNARDTEDEQT